MRRHYLLGAVAVLAASGLLVWAWHRFAERPAAPGTVATAAPTVPDCAAAPQAVAAAARTRIPDADAPSTNPAPPPGPARPAGFAPYSMDPRLVKNPEFRAALLDQNRVGIEQEFRDLPKALGLSADQTDKLFDLLAEQQVRSIETQWVKYEPGSPAGNRQDGYTRNREELAGLLGPSNMIRYDEFRATLPGRVEVNSVRNELARGPEPLREEQVEPFVAVVNTELQRLEQEVRDSGPPDPMRTDPATYSRQVALTIAANQRIVDAVRPLLSVAQLAGLKDLYRRQRLQMESASTLNRLRTEAAASIPPGTAPR